MRVDVGERAVRGRAVDLADADVSPRAVLRAIRGEDSAVVVDCPDPGPMHDHVGYVDSDASVALRSALAAAARSRGLAAPQDEALREARHRLEGLSPPEAAATAERRRAAEAGDEEHRLRERAAALRGRLQALRETGDEDAVAEAERDLADAVERLSEVETDRIAADQRLEQVESRTREARDVRERRFALQDRIGNLERAARRALAEAVWDEFADAIGAVPSTDADVVGDGPGTYRGDPVTAALATARVGEFSAPVVLAVRRFDGADAAATCLDAPVVRV